MLPAGHDMCDNTRASRIQPGEEAAHGTPFSDSLPGKHARREVEEALWDCSLRHG